MSNFHQTLSTVLIDQYTRNAARIRELAAPLTDDQFWHKPFPFGNSFGHLVLHLAGNLNYYVGAQIAHTGYVRDRPKEFADASPPSKDDTLRRLDEAVSMVIATIRSQSSDDWTKDYSGVGANAKNRLDMVAQCASHMQHHIGQMIYLGYQAQREKG